MGRCFLKQGKQFQTLSSIWEMGSFSVFCSWERVRFSTTHGVKACKAGAGSEQNPKQISKKGKRQANLKILSREFYPIAIDKVPQVANPGSFTPKTEDACVQYLRSQAKMWIVFIITQSSLQNKSKHGVAIQTHWIHDFCILSCLVPARERRREEGVRWVHVCVWDMSWMCVLSAILDLHHTWSWVQGFRMSLPEQAVGQDDF